MRLRRWWHRCWWPTLDPDSLADGGVVVAHEWFTRGGSDKVAAAMAEASGAGALVCLSLNPEVLDDLGIAAPVHQCRLGSWASQGRRWQLLLPLMPVIWGSLDLGATATVVTSSHSLVNSIRPIGHRISYCHTPVRYGWEWRMELGRLPRLARPMLGPVAWMLRRWDRRMSRRVDVYIANSRFVAERIHRAYGREAMVIHPPIDTTLFVPPTDDASDSQGGRSDEFLVVGRLIPYKRADVAVAAATKAGVRLLVAGWGPERQRLEALAGPTVRFLEWPGDDELVALMQRARALLHPGIEDFGMIVLEAQACGTPVIARAAGGARDSMDPSCSGELLESDDVAEWAAALAGFADPASADQRRRWALGFSAEVFTDRFRQVLSGVITPAVRE